MLKPKQRSFASLAEGIEFDSEESFTEKLTTVKESYFPKEEVQLKEDIATDVAKTIDDPRMAAYVRAINAQR